MASPHLRTSDIAKALGVHINTVRLYESRGFLPPIPRGKNGYRQYNAIHLEQARLAYLTLSWPYLGSRSLLIELVKSAAQADFGRAMELAYRYLAQVRVTRTEAEVALEFLERWAAGLAPDRLPQKLSIGQAATYLNVTVDMLRNWERNGLIAVPRNPSNHYRLYGPAALERARVIYMLVQSGFSLMAILHMLRQVDAGDTNNLRAALELPHSERANEAIEIMADRWLSSLSELEQRALAIIQHLDHMIELVRSSSSGSPAAP
jgi:DNA-binding transcriptional MerR regulator